MRLPVWARSSGGTTHSRKGRPWRPGGDCVTWAPVCDAYKASNDAVTLWPYRMYICAMRLPNGSPLVARKHTNMPEWARFGSDLFAARAARPVSRRQTGGLCVVAHLVCVYPYPRPCRDGPLAHERFWFVARTKYPKSTRLVFALTGGFGRLHVRARQPSVSVAVHGGVVGNVAIAQTRYKPDRSCRADPVPSQSSSL